jgi:nucleoside-diphosphate-sugar epimerase
MSEKPTASPVVAVLGSSGFVGGALERELRARGVHLRPVTAPRLCWWPDLTRLDTVPGDLHGNVVEALAGQLDGAQVVVNAAGLPDGTAPASEALYGANALLPILVARACALTGVDRFIHVSSAAVQGGRALDETANTDPFSPYSSSKALGERLMLREHAVTQVIFRSTWVHDIDRPNTRALVRLARSRASCVAGDGSAPTPQVLVSDVAAALAHLALVPGPVPPIVLQPPSGMTTGLILRLLSGREPRHLSPVAARAMAGGVRVCAPLGRRLNAYARRIEMLLFGKRQAPGWLADQGVVGALRLEAWQQLGAGAGGHTTGRTAK